MNERGKKGPNTGIEGDWITVGVFGAPHGVQGAVRLKSFTDDPEALFLFRELHTSPMGPKVAVARERKSKDGFIVWVKQNDLELGGIARIDSPEAAAKLKGTQLWLHRDALPEADEDEFYLADLIGLKALDVSGAHLGRVNAVENFGAEDLVELALAEPIKGLGRYAFVPFRKELVTAVDLTAGTLTVDMAAWQELQTGKTAESALAKEEEA